MNASELATLMNENAMSIAEHLLPHGKKSAGEWKVGNVAGDAGDSLSVRVTGNKRGVWKDFASGESGDMLDLWAACRALSAAQAMAEAKAYLGVRDIPFEKKTKDYKRPTKPKCQTPKAGVSEWLQSRGINPETIADFRIGEQVQNGKTYAVFPYLRDGELINAKYRNVAEKKDMRQEGGAEPCLFGWHLIYPKARIVAICEGEIDALSLHQMGITALSVNAGAGNHQWIDSDFDRLERFSEIYLCYDNDEAGEKGAREVANRLGLERCKVVKFGDFKDANDFLMSSKDDPLHYLAFARPFDPDELRQLSDYWNEVKASFYPADGERISPILMFPGLQCDWFEFRKGELTVWTGYNGHGKSLMLNQVLIGLMNQNEKICVFSGEMVPKNQGRRMAKQLTGLDRPAPGYLDETGNWIRDRAWLFDLVGTATIDRLLEVFRYGYKRYGIGHFVIDSLMMTDVPEDGAGSMSAQKDAMRKLAGFCRELNVHIHLVAHPRKGQDEKKAPGKLDIAGSSKLTDAADNVFVVWSAQKQDGEEPATPDAFLELHKQRNGETQHRKTWLYFNKACQQFSGNELRRPHQYVTYSKHEVSA